MQQQIITKTVQVLYETLQEYNALFRFTVCSKAFNAINIC